MNREIKFRAWDKENNYMVNEFTLNSNGTIDRDWYIKLMQYTGLKDKNGVDIYEGDILKCDDYQCAYSRSGIYKVEYCLPDCAFCLVQLDEKSSTLFNEIFEYEIIGNIYENKELIK